MSSAEFHVQAAAAFCQTHVPESLTLHSPALIFQQCRQMSLFYTHIFFLGLFVAGQDLLKTNNILLKESLSDTPISLCLSVFLFWSAEHGAVCLLQ